MNAKSIINEQLWGYNAIRRHCQVTIDGLEKELDQLHAIMDKDLENATSHETEAYLSNINDYYIETSETLPRLQYYGLFLLIYAHFEYTLNKLSNSLQEDLHLDLKLKDIYGQGILRSKIYLKKVCKLNLPILENNWSIFLLYLELRNTIAHSYGAISNDAENPHPLIKRISSISGIELDDPCDNTSNLLISLRKDFLEKMMDTILETLHDIFNNLDD